MIELAILLPFLLTLVYSGIEFGRYTLLHLEAGKLARELASSALMECGLLTEPAEMTACIEANIEQSIMTEYAGSGVQSTVSVYRWNPTTQPSSPFHTQRLALVPGGAPTRLGTDFFLPDNLPDDIADGPAASSHALLLLHHETLFYAEVFAEFHPLLPALFSFVGTSQEPIYVVNAA
ncbi:MAG: pilus assembly protein [Oligoflexia bacterium]|nr:pilus assembly protein [Oligoflexia bacterium]